MINAINTLNLGAMRFLKFITTFDVDKKNMKDEINWINIDIPIKPTNSLQSISTQCKKCSCTFV